MADVHRKIEALTLAQADALLNAHACQKRQAKLNLQIQELQDEHQQLWEAQRELATGAGFHKLKKAMLFVHRLGVCSLLDRQRQTMSPEKDPVEKDPVEKDPVSPKMSDGDRVAWNKYVDSLTPADIPVGLSLEALEMSKYSTHCLQYIGHGVYETAQMRTVFEEAEAVVDIEDPVLRQIFKWVHGNDPETFLAENVLVCFLHFYHFLSWLNHAQLCVSFGFRL